MAKICTDSQPFPPQKKDAEKDKLGIKSIIHRHITTTLYNFFFQSLSFLQLMHQKEADVFSVVRTYTMIPRAIEHKGGFNA